MTPAGRIEATLFTSTCFSSSACGDESLEEVTASSVELVRECVKVAPLVVDVPIDLQGLPSAPNPTWLWELTNRPVDYAFKALPPLASLIGSCVARFAHLHGLAGTPSTLGTHLFETYPAASLELLKLDRKGYKGHAYFSDEGKWEPAADPVTDAAGDATAETKRAKRRRANSTFARTLNALKWTATPNQSLSHDDFDAVLCAVTGLALGASVLEGAALREEIELRVRTRMESSPDTRMSLQAPLGYRLLKDVPPPVELGVAADLDDAELLRHVRQGRKDGPHA